KPLTYDWSSTDNKIKEYKKEANLEILFVINPFSNYEHKDGREHEGRYLPDGDQSFLAYKDYLTKLITRYKGKVDIWSVSNEPKGEYQDNIDDYVKLVKTSYEIIKSIDPQAQVNLGGVGAGQKLDFHRKVLEGLREACPGTGCFDVFDYHTYSWNYRDYDIKNVIRLKSDDCQIEFTKTHQDYKNLLESAGFGDKPIINKEGATHTGEFKDLNQPYWCYLVQTEFQQAEFLFKRAIHQLANNIKMINWSTLGEKEKGDCDVRFTITGLIYGGLDECNKDNPYDAGMGVKKLSYYTYKFLIEKLKSSDFNNVRIINTSVPNVYLYELNQEDKPLYVSWWDYFAQGESGETKTATLSLLDINAPQVKITQAIPNFLYDFQTKKIQLNERDYPDFFDSSLEFVSGNTITVTLSKKPVFIDGFNSLRIINPKNKARLTPDSTLKILIDPGDVTNIKNVYFFIDDKNKCQDSGLDKEGYYACDWKTPKKSKQSYKITVKAYNKSELIAEDSVEVVVD
ncbi:MAG: Ig-like domain-containing protein, partial [Patescibacteria group bacterium]